MYLDLRRGLYIYPFDSRLPAWIFGPDSRFNGARHIYPLSHNDSHRDPCKQRCVLGSGTARRTAHSGPPPPASADRQRDQLESDGPGRHTPFELVYAVRNTVEHLVQLETCWSRRVRRTDSAIFSREFRKLFRIGAVDGDGFEGWRPSEINTCDQRAFGLF